MDSLEKYKAQITSHDFVMSEVNKLRVLYKLKKEIRYDHKRETDSDTESVAEHIYAMHSLSDYFLQSEDPEGKLNRLKIYKMIQYHEVGEIETGDIAGFKKTEQDYIDEKLAVEKVINRLPIILQERIQDIVTEYDEQKTSESKFVKALDKIELNFHMYDKTGKKFLHDVKYTRELHSKYKGNHTKAFPVMSRFEEVLEEQYEKEGFYYNES